MSWIREWALPLGVTTALLLTSHSSAPVRTAAADEAGPRPLRVLFLGHNRDHHPSAALLPLLAAPLARRGIQLTHVMTPEEALDARDAGALRRADDLREPQDDHAGTGSTRCSSSSRAARAWWRSTARRRCSPTRPVTSRSSAASSSVTATGEFTAEIVAPGHPAIEGVTPFTTWDETYVHTKHNPVDRTVLMERVDEQGREPYTWVRTQGKGRVFYTAFGHDQRTWSQPGFQQLVEQGVVWAVDDAARAVVAAAEDARGRPTSTASTCRTTRTAIRRRSIRCRCLRKTR